MSSPIAVNIVTPCLPTPAAIERAEQRMAMLRDLAEMGMRVCRDLSERAIMVPVDPEPRHHPAESFARVSRAVRLTLALEAKFDEELTGALNGDSDDDEDDDDRPGWTKARYIDPLDPENRDQPSAHRNKIRDAVWDVLDHEVTDLEPAVDVLEALHERLSEGERYDPVVFRPLRESVEAICKDLGLHPDWSRWTEDGFPRDTRAIPREWSSMWLPNMGHRSGRDPAPGTRMSSSALPPAPS